jgi:peptidoglycan/xylan/chitin deacetylase (PgdA/CDA1 family)
MRVGTILISRSRCHFPLHSCLLTFDDGPAGMVTDELLAVLRDFQVKACFCLVGCQVAIWPEQTRAIAAAGHFLVNHTFHHRFADLFSLDRLNLDLTRCDQAICDALGETSRPLPWFRPPFGLVTAAVRETAKARRILPVTLFAFDPWCKSERTSWPGRWIIQNANRHDGGIYVLHDGLLTSGITRMVRGSPRRTWIPRVVNQVLGELTAAGFQFPNPSQALEPGAGGVGSFGF